MPKQGQMGMLLLWLPHSLEGNSHGGARHQTHRYIYIGINALLSLFFVVVELRSALGCILKNSDISVMTKKIPLIMRTEEIQNKNS